MSQCVDDAHSLVVTVYYYTGLCIVMSQTRNKRCKVIGDDYLSSLPHIKKSWVVLTGNYKFQHVHLTWNTRIHSAIPPLIK